MNAIRTFIGIEIPPSIQGTLGRIIDQLSQIVGNAVRWVPPNNIHLTLKFIGNISSSNLSILSRVLESEVANYSAFQFHICHLGVFPNPKRPRVVWTGIQAPDMLLKLHDGIEQETRRLGYPAEERAFSPHLTLGRVGNNVLPQDLDKLRQALGNIKADDLGTVLVESVSLFRSDVIEKQRVYTPIFTVRLKAI